MLLGRQVVKKVCMWQAKLGACINEPTKRTRRGTLVPDIIYAPGHDPRGDFPPMVRVMEEPSGKPHPEGSLGTASIPCSYGAVQGRSPGCPPGSESGVLSLHNPGPYLILYTPTTATLRSDPCKMKSRFS